MVLIIDKVNHSVDIFEQAGGFGYSKNVMIESYLGYVRNLLVGLKWKKKKKRKKTQSSSDIVKRTKTLKIHGISNIKNFLMKESFMMMLIVDHCQFFFSLTVSIILLQGKQNL